jgi:phosphotransferase system enzyme I (PtsI)
VLRRPDDAVVERAVAGSADRRRRLAAGSGPGRTADGVPVELLVNIGGGRELATAAAADAEGVGLFRTEFLFLDRPEPPARAEQEEAYARVFEGFAGRKVVVRTLDAGADKPLRFVTVPDEPNPALGVRGLRTARRHPELLDEQLAAIAAAAAHTSAEVWVMAPMVSTVEETEYFVGLAHELGLRTAGVMVEVPSLALTADRVLKHADFASIGTNDLTQYTLAADRMLGSVANFQDPWHPAVLRLVGEVGAAGAALGKPVGICGEAAADPLLAVVLVGLGATSLSMSASALADVRASLAGFTLAQARELAAAALAADGADSARSAAAEAAAATRTTAPATPSL